MNLPFTSLRQQLTVAVIIFLVAVTTVVTAFTVISNERAEKFTWTTMLGFEMDRVAQLGNHDDAPERITASNPGNRILFFRESPGNPIPPPFSALSPGVHDDIRAHGRLFATMVRGEGSGRQVLAVDVSSVEHKEHELATQALSTIAGLMLVFGLIAIWGLSRFLKPLHQLSDEIALLSPETRSQALPPISQATSEITTIYEAINGYVDRNHQFLQREREFIRTASHELRTPIAILRNNLQLAQSDLDHGINPSHRLQRSSQIVKEMGELLSVLLVLARDPSKLAPLQECVDLREIVNEVTQQHEHLLEPKELRIAVDGQGVNAHVPPTLAHVALSNLIRNAIENSDRGTIHVHVEEPGVVSIVDPGHGMTPQEISALYAAAARGGNPDRQLGIGLQLLSRICSHLGWSLEFVESANGHTQATLRFPSAKKSS